MFLSIIICTRNRAIEIANCLPQVVAQASRFSDVEVIIVDNGSTDNTREVIENLSKDFKFAVRYVYEPVPGLCQARNRGRVEAAAQIIAYIDDDERVGEDWIEGIKQHFLEEKSDCLGGRIKVFVEGESPLHYSEDMLWFFGATSLGDEARFLQYPQYPQGGNFALKTGVFDAVGGFDTNLKLYGDETEFFRRVDGKGFTMYYNPNIEVIQSIPAERLTIAELQHKSYIWGEGSATVWMLASPGISSRMAKIFEFVGRTAYMAFKKSSDKKSFGKFYTFWYNRGYLRKLISGLEK